jgi:hypothetical protein
MIRRLALAAGLFTLAACQPSTPAAPETAPPAGPETEAATPAGTANTCEARSHKMWGPIGPGDQPSNRVEAWTSGSTCETAVVTLAVYARDGFPIYAWAGAAQHLFGLNEAKDPAAMQEKLSEWMGPDNLPPDMTGTLPPWDETDGQPKRAEFPFMPNMGKDAYEDLRKQNLHMLCFPQGMESQLCLALHEGPMVEDIGLQLFPG